MIFQDEGGVRRRHELPVFQNDSGRHTSYGYGSHQVVEASPAAPAPASGIYTSRRHRRRRITPTFTATPVPPTEADDSHFMSLMDDDIQDRRCMDRKRILSYARGVITLALLCAAIIYIVENQVSIQSPFELIVGLTTMVPKTYSSIRNLKTKKDDDDSDDEDEVEEDIGPRPDFVYEHPYVSSSYYTSTKSMKTLLSTQNQQVVRNLRKEAERAAGIDSGDENEIKTRLAIVRPFCEFDAEALPTTFTCWNALPPCKAAADDLGDDDEDYEVDSYGELVGYNKNTTAGRNLYDQATSDRHMFDLVGSDAMKSANADVFLFYSQTFSENQVAITAVDTIIDQFFEPGGWSQCFGNIYAIEANIPQELDLYIPSAQEELYSWVNGPNRQFEAAFRIIQSGEWGEYDGFYLMEGDSVPVKAHWLDIVLSEIEVYRPFAILGE